MMGAGKELRLCAVCLSSGECPLCPILPRVWWELAEQVGGSEQAVGVMCL